MTGYGKAVATIEGKKITVEIKSLNSKQLDLSIKAPSIYREKELEWRSYIQEMLQRGKIDLVVSVEITASSEMPQINNQILATYKEQISNAMSSLGLMPPSKRHAQSSAIMMQTLLRLPDVVSIQQVSALPDELDTVTAAVKDAVQKLTGFRTQEGQSLYTMFTEKISGIRGLLSEVEPYEKSRTEKIRDNIVEKLSQLPVDYDRNRLEQEMIYYIEKLDINEEKHRLTNHLDYFIETMDSPVGPGGHGKKLGFIAQEMGREINTLGSKSNQAEMQRIVVKMKDLLEQIKEQVLNVM